MKASDHQERMVVHEIQLNGDALTEEAFLHEGRGSAFESRPDEIVVLEVTGAGVAQVGEKVRQLVERGFHGIAVVLGGVEASSLGGGEERAMFEGLREGHEYAGRFVGRVVLCEVDDNVRVRLEDLSRESSEPVTFEYCDTRAQAIGALSGGDEGESADPLVVESSDLLTSEDAGSEDDWGWMPEEEKEPSQADREGLPEVAIAELFVQDDEVRQLARDVRIQARRGKPHVNLRLHFNKSRETSSEDVQALVAAREELSELGGLLVLVSPQADFLQWLDLLDARRGFVIVEDEESAELAHRRHAGGQGVGDVGGRDGGGGSSLEGLDVWGSEPVLEAPVSRFEVEESGESVVVRSREGLGGEVEASGRLIDLGPGGLGALRGRVEELLSAGWVQEVLLDLGRFGGLEGVRLEPVEATHRVVSEQGLELVCYGAGDEVVELLKILGLPEEQVVESYTAALERVAERRGVGSEVGALRLELVREELLEGPEVVVPAASEEELGSLRAELATAQAEVGRLREAVTRAGEQVREAKSEAARAVEQAQELRGVVQRAERRASELEQERGRFERQISEAGQERERGQTERLQLQEQVEELRREVETTESLRQALEAAQASSASFEGEATQAKAQVEQLEQRCQRLQESLNSVQEVNEHQEQVRASELEQLRSRVGELEGQLASGGGSAGESALEAASSSNGEWESRCKALEVEKARILAEAEEEIQRLTHEHELLREELESAGEMIERLGKELELS